MTQEPPAISRATIAWIFALPLMVAWPLPLVFSTEILARSDTEAAIHIWGLWAAGVSGHPFIVQTAHMAWPEGFVGVLVDPINLPAFLLGLLVSVPLAYNLIAYIGLVVSGLAGACLARRAGGAPMLGAMVGAASPPLLAQTGLGMTETFAVGVVGLTLVALLRALDGPGWRWRILAGLGLGMSWYAGPYNGVWSSLICAVVGAAALIRRESPIRQRLATLGAVAGVGIALAMPLAWAVLTLRVPGQPGTGAAAGLQLCPAPSRTCARAGYSSPTTATNTHSIAPRAPCTTHTPSTSRPTAAVVSRRRCV